MKLNLHEVSIRKSAVLSVILLAAVLLSCQADTDRPADSPADLPPEWTADANTESSTTPGTNRSAVRSTSTPAFIETTPPPRSNEFESPPASAEKGYAWTSAVDGKTMLFIPSGPSYIGARSDYGYAEPDERPQVRLSLDAFWIDETEVTNAEYEACVEEGSCSAPLFTGSATRDTYYGVSAFAEYPVIGIQWYQARDYCTWIGGSLPSEAQWEKAARSPDGRRYPWEWVGSVYNPREEIRLNYCDSECTMPSADSSYSDGFADTAPAGSFPAGASPYGVLDMAGNVWEWTSDWYSSSSYEHIALENPEGPEQGLEKVIKGGSWMDGLNNGIPLIFRSSNRTYRLPYLAYVDLGFRCVIPGGAD